MGGQSGAVVGGQSGAAVGGQSGAAVGGQSGAAVGGQSGAVVSRPHGNDQDVVSNPAATRHEKRTLGGPPTEGSPMVQQDLSGRPAM